MATAFPLVSVKRPGSEEPRVLLQIANGPKIEIQPLTPKVARHLARQLRATANLIEEKPPSPPPDQPAEPYPGYTNDTTVNAYQTSKVI